MGGISIDSIGGISNIGGNDAQITNAYNTIEYNLTNPLTLGIIYLLVINVTKH